MKTIILTPAQSIEARENLSLTQPVVSAGVKAQFPAITFSKTYLSEWEGGRRNLMPLAQRALRDYYEAQGHEFTDTPQAVDDELKPGEQVRVVKDALVVCDRLTHSQRGAIQERISELLSKLRADGKQKSVAGFFEPFDEDTDAKRDKAIAVLAEIGLLYTLLFRQCPIEAPSDVLLNKPNTAKTISDVVSIRFGQTFKSINYPDMNIRSDVGASDDDSDDPILDSDGVIATVSRAAPSEKNIWGY